MGIDGDLRQQLTDALWEIRDRRGVHHLPFHDVFQREYHQTTKESMATPPLLKRMIGSIVDIGTIESNYRSTATIPETGMELPVKVGEERNPLFATHIEERLSLLCHKPRLRGGPDFHERYKEQWENDEPYGTADDLVMHIMEQPERPVPSVGDFNALGTSNVFSTLFASNLGQGVNSQIIDRSNFADGIGELRTSLKNSGSSRLSLYVQGYNGPWGSFPMPTGLKMPQENEDRLRE
ncbi:MAG: hypothetical protein GY820_11685, partial [Gammaproteobacteria bacterium]|nr:hypothetical protein [Gammaproteobacteria bacterium]